MSLFEFHDSQDTAAAPDAAQVWQSCLADLKYMIEEYNFRQWIEPLKVQSREHELVLFTPNGMWSSHLKKNFQDKLDEVVLKHGGGVLTSTRIEVMVSTTPSTPKKAAPKKIKQATVIEEGLAIEPAFTFEAFVRGKSNLNAYNACFELSKKDAKYHSNKIFIFGSSGLGKTHLMHAMAHRYIKQGKSVCYFTKDHFHTVTRPCFTNNGVDQFVKKVCKADLLIIDDLHTYDGKSAPRTVDLLMRLFDEFSKDNTRQVVMASDQPPLRMHSFGDRNMSRLSACLSIAIEVPDMDLRVQILEKKAMAIGIELPRDCAIFMAQNLPADVRALEGAVKQVELMAQLRHEPVTLNLVADAIKSQVQERARAVNAENIRDLVAEFYQISPKDMMGKKRVRTIARPRQIAMALIRELTNDSFPEIGQVFGGRDHTTVMHACEKVKELIETDASVEKDYHSLRLMLQYQ